MSKAGRHVKDGPGDLGLDREIVGSFSSYPEAERAVSDLAERIPPDKLEVVGQGLQTVPARSGQVRSSVEAGVIGTAVGALVILLAAITIGDAVPEGITVRALLVGAACGFVAGVAAVLTTGSASTRPEGRLYAERYDLAADPRVAEKAIREITAWRIARRSKRGR